MRYSITIRLEFTKALPRGNYQSKPVRDFLRHQLKLDQAASPKPELRGKEWKGNLDGPDGLAKLSQFFKLLEELAARPYTKWRDKPNSMTLTLKRR